jgi:hypothetical protein
LKRLGVDQFEKEGWLRGKDLNLRPLGYEAEEVEICNSFFCIWFPGFLLIDKALRDFDLVESVRSVLVFSVVFEHKISTTHRSVGGSCCDHDHTLV